jgi:predicted nucleic acid-binding protein
MPRSSRRFSIAIARVEVLDAARALLDLYPALKARDALHAAATQHYGARALCSFDSDFDQIQGIERIEPPC